MQPQNITGNIKKSILNNMTNHKLISFIKSGIRILGYIAIFFIPIEGLILLILAEILGILEEKYENK